MIPKLKLLTQERLKELVGYNPETGVFTCLKAPNNRRKFGSLLGSLDDRGYLVARLDYKLYKLHRLAFLYMTGSIPEASVDHINGDKSDNRWSNLREATQSQNAMNQKLRTNSKTKVKGLTYENMAGRNPCYRAVIAINGKKLIKSITVSGRVEAEVVAELTAWLYQKRNTLHREFARHD